MTQPKNNKKAGSILVVEDDVDLSEVFNILLSKEGFDVTNAYDGREALELLSKERYDLILLDLIMPNVDGRSFLRLFDNKHKIPIIVFSNLDTSSAIQEVQELGAARYILKAWASPKELIRVINDTIDQNQK